MSRVRDRIALVTGASRGIGLACARLLHREGAVVVLSDIRDEQGERAAHEIGPRASYRRLDVREEADWRRVIGEIVREHARLDILVNNAGVSGFNEGLGPQDPEHASLEDWRAVHAVNSDGVFLGCKHAIGAMKASRAASIVNISSRSGLVGIPGAAAYAASKAAVRNHTKTVALYCAERGYPIRCNSLHPGAVLTPMWDPLLGEGEARERSIAVLGAEVPLRRMGAPEDVARAVLFLASDDSSYVTGVELNVDGGVLAGSSATARARE